MACSGKAGQTSFDYANIGGVWLYVVSSKAQRKISSASKGKLYGTHFRIQLKVKTRHLIRAALQIVLPHLRSKLASNFITGWQWGGFGAGWRSSPQSRIRSSLQTCLPFPNQKFLFRYNLDFRDIPDNSQNETRIKTEAQFSIIYFLSKKQELSNWIWIIVY